MRLIQPIDLLDLAAMVIASRITTVNRFSLRQEAIEQRDFPVPMTFRPPARLRPVHRAN